MVIRKINMCRVLKIKKKIWNLATLLAAFERELSVRHALHLRVICLVILNYKQINIVWQSREA